MGLGYTISDPAELKSQRSVTGRGSFIVGTHTAGGRSAIADVRAYTEWKHRVGYQKKKSTLDRVSQGVNVVVGAIGVAGIGYGVGAGAGFWGAPASAAPAVAAAPVPVGMTAAAGLPAYAPQITAAQSLTGAGVAGVAPVAAKTSFAVAAKSAADVVASAGSIAGTVAAVRGAGMSAEAALPAYEGQMVAAAQVPTAREVARPGAAPDKTLLAGVGLVALAMLFLKTT